MFKSDVFLKLGAKAAEVKVCQIGMERGSYQFV